MFVLRLGIHEGEQWVEACEKEIQPGNKEDFPHSEYYQTVEQITFWSCGCANIGGFQKKNGQLFVPNGMRPLALVRELD